MGKGIVDSATQMEAPDDRRIYGVATAQVITNCDQTNQGRIKVRFPWLPGYEPWARVAALMAGANGGTFFMPQKNEEVLVAFNHGDIREPYIVGCVWNGKDRPPEQAASDPENLRIIRTPKGLQVEFDDQKQSITISNKKDKQIVIASDSIEITLDKDAKTTIKLDQNGNITLKAASTITLDAPTINILAKNNLALGGQDSARIDGGSYCSINATKIYIG
jgi:uncharacterized protein involved in type VI secretion and phage assembly